ncbi:hypothetical protein BDZ91DRAFT_184841 [Kalaharituber pfeilii]|nr:hypothetical protein BDZ91DRAFT_184841 [Kalaharituber pfeilii]
MWLRPLSLLAVLAAFLNVHIAAATSQLYERGNDGSLTDQNAILEPVGGKVDTSIPVVVKWSPDTEGTVTILLVKGNPKDMKPAEVIAYSIENRGRLLWITGTTLEDSSTMPKDNKYAIMIIDDKTGNYNLSPTFDLSVPGSTFKIQSDMEEKNGGHQKGSGSTKSKDENDKDTLGPVRGSNNAPSSTSSKTSNKTSSKKSKLSKGAIIGIVVGVISLIAIIALVIVFLKIRSRRRYQASKKRSQIGYDGVGAFLSEARQSKLYGQGEPQMSQYSYSRSTLVAGGAYDPPAGPGQGVPVVGSTSYTSYDPPTQAKDTRYDPPPSIDATPPAGEKKH